MFHLGQFQCKKQSDAFIDSGQCLGPEQLDPRPAQEFRCSSAVMEPFKTSLAEEEAALEQEGTTVLRGSFNINSFFFAVFHFFQSSPQL